MSIVSPDFGSDVSHRAQPCTPQELYAALRDADEHVHYHEPAFHFAVAQIGQARAAHEWPVDEGAATYVDSLLAGARPDLVARPFSGCSRSWPIRVATEFAAVGLTDGAWLHGLCRIAHVENEIGMASLRQMMARCGDPGSRESYPLRYAALLRSLGVAPGSIGRWELEEMSPCIPLSYEHALLGLSLGLFPSTLRPETVGYNLWMAAIGPCPLLEHVASALRERGACLSYLDQHDRGSMTALATDMVRHLLDGPDAMPRSRVADGFFAAHRSYLRWETALCGANVPMTPRERVIEIVARKARFATGHHGHVRLGDRSLDDCFAEGAAGAAGIVDRLAASPWIRAGQPDASPLLCEAITFGGPMFDIFTAGEREDLREWILALHDERSATPADSTAVAIEGVYTPPQDPESVRQFAMTRFTNMPTSTLAYHLVNADRCPAASVFAKWLGDVRFQRLHDALASDPRLSAVPAPEYSERAVTELVVALHSRNVESQSLLPQDLPRPGLAVLLDGSWLQGFANVVRAGVEEWGWLFRIYASEMGDGRLAWNHNYIARQMYRTREPAVMLPATDPGLYDALEVNDFVPVNMAMVLNTRHFLPELLGLNLAVEARSVCGTYVTAWKRHEQQHEPWAALYNRLHNSIDNYASGHTKWSVAAVQAFMARVRDVTPHAVDAQWRRIWNMWRASEILDFGTADERRALAEVRTMAAAGAS